MYKQRFHLLCETNEMGWTTERLTESSSTTKWHLDWHHHAVFELMRSKETNFWSEPSLPEQVELIRRRIFLKRGEMCRMEIVERELFIGVAQYCAVFAWILSSRCKATIDGELPDYQRNRFWKWTCLRTDWNVLQICIAGITALGVGSERILNTHYAPFTAVQTACWIFVFQRFSQYFSHPTSGQHFPLYNFVELLKALASTSSQPRPLPESIALDIWLRRIHSCFLVCWTRSLVFRSISRYVCYWIRKHVRYTENFCNSRYAFRSMKYIKLEVTVSKRGDFISSLDFYSRKLLEPAVFYTPTQQVSDTWN